VPFKERVFGSKGTLEVRPSICLESVGLNQTVAPKNKLVNLLTEFLLNI
jgi:hypothetical protein